MRKKRNNPAAMRCPYCGSPVILRSADGIYRENACLLYTSDAADE